MSAPIRVLIVDDHAVVREGLELFLAERPGDIEVVGQAADGEDALPLAQKLKPDVILMDLMMPRMGGIEATRRLKEAGVTSRVLMLTTFADDQQVRDAIQAGAIGYLLKDVQRSDLLAAIRAAADGRATLHPEAQQRLLRQLTTPAPASPIDALTDREKDVLRLIARGKSNKAIANTLKLSVGTVKGYVSAILAKLGARDRTQAALIAVRNGMESD
jgi:two-component system, NarL family, response regulator LiaR